jgi:hypothetical protein
MFKHIWSFPKMFLGVDGDGAPPATPPPASSAITAESVGALKDDGFRAILPKDIASKPYMKDVNNFGDFIKKFDGAQSLLGQRVIPDATATPDQWKEFHAKTTPKTAEEYKFPDTIEGISPEVAKQAGAAKWLKPLLHSAQISPHQASILYPEFLKLMAAAETADKKFSEDAFAKMSTELFKDQKDVIVTNAKKFMATHLAPEMLPMLETLDDKQMTLLIAMTDGMAQKFTGEMAPAEVAVKRKRF